MKPNDDRHKQPEKDSQNGFHYIDKHGNPSDEGLHDEMLMNDEEISRQLQEAGVVRVINLESISSEEAIQYIIDLFGAEAMTGRGKYKL